MGDKRDCSKCGIRMEWKTSLGHNEEFEPELWQCPKCKNVEVIYARIGRGYRYET